MVYWSLPSLVSKLDQFLKLPKVAKVLDDIIGSGIPYTKDNQKIIINQVKKRTGFGGDNLNDTSWSGFKGTLAFMGLIKFERVSKPEIIKTTEVNKLLSETDDPEKVFLLQMTGLQYPNPTRPKTNKEREEWGKDGVKPFIFTLEVLEGLPNDGKHVTIDEMAKCIMNKKSMNDIQEAIDNIKERRAGASSSTCLPLQRRDAGSWFSWFSTTGCMECGSDDGNRILRKKNV